MDLVGLVSGGKDSLFNLLAATRLGHRVVCLANLHPAPPAAAGDAGDAAAPEELDSFMFQTVGHTTIGAVAECMGLPLVRRATAGHSAHRGLHYPADAAAAAAAGAAPAAVVDEVEDLHALLADVVARHPSVRGVGVGAILSSYQRLRVEAVCARLGLVPVALLWQRRQGGLLRDMVDAGLDAVLVKVASLGLSPRMLGVPLGQLQPQLHGLHARFGLNVCGEGGEYETITRYCPGLYSHGRLVADDAVVERPSSDVAHWAIRRCHVERHPEGAESGSSAAWEDAAGAAAVALPAPLVGAGRRAGPVAVTPAGAAAACAAIAAALTSSADALQPAQPPPIRAVGAYVHVGGLTAHSPLVRALVTAQMDGDDDADGGTVSLRAAVAAVDDVSLPPAQRAAAEVRVVFAALRVLLASAGASLADVAFVHLYLADMGTFGPVNAAYCEYFGDQPPSRSTVAIAMPPSSQPQPALLLDCVALARSGAALRAPDNGSSSSGGGHPSLPPPPPPHRSTLHVQSLSHWAPLCIGPYCQANTLGGGGGGGSGGSGALVLAAGSIGMLPHTMALVAPSPALSAAAGPSLAPLLAQGHQALLNVARVLAAVDTGLPRALAVTVYVAAPYAAGAPEGGAAASDDAGVDAVTALVRAWVGGLQGRGRPPSHAADDGAALANDDDDDGAGSDGTFSPPGSEDGDGGDSDSCRDDDVADAAPTTLEADPCRERDFSLGPHAHVPPQYLPLLPPVGSGREGPAARRRALRALLAGAQPAVPPAAAAADPCLAGLPALPRALAAALPVRTVVVPALPRGAAVEVEVVSAGAPAAGVVRCWQDEVAAEAAGGVTVRGSCYFFAAAATTDSDDGAASTAAASAFVDVTRSMDDDDAAATDQAAAAAVAAAAVRMGARAVAHAGLSPVAHTLHVRAYYQLAGAPESDGGGVLEAALQRAVAAELGGGGVGAAPPAVTVLPAALPPDVAGNGDGADRHRRRLLLLHVLAVRG
jgi:diphthine-ammonia ligase